ncbi:ESCRT-III subunit protein DID4 KNAG_0A06810 [Huiozyma naganishii CBS 8797]|uniref:DOA4-independent degradation protein 4 n=1 Tax=Huiozyma naganishii (strain ATCC MYA-139 / BCRC 22969 / CBS 8797 / KCTC 17520 / NBRC 10181 / NCYC 3082 / Yp74L-3) TaxID=1071383 RepID=J7R0K3_HUIN7|nr:hypothetical protein KNAG_0A06810 [Kazachstania naganishii CBS 8797]CCK68335.1 hypothetical protein KNAG_0A06810 [Kazachstania naganishii CBS 8797]
MGMFEWAFGKSLTPQERLKKNQRALDRTQRELEREKKKLEAQEARLVREIKKAAKENQVGAARIKAKDLVRTKNYIQRFSNMQTQLQAISLRIQAVRSTDQMARSMRDASGLLAGMNRSMNLPQLQRISMEFEKQNDLMDQRQEFMDEAVDGVMADDELDEDEEAEEIVNKVLDEIGVDLNAQLSNRAGPLGSLQGVQQPLAEGGADSQQQQQQMLSEAGPTNPDDELQARLDSLKKQ